MISVPPLIHSQFCLQRKISSFSNNKTFIHMLMFTGLNWRRLYKSVENFAELLNALRDVFFFREFTFVQEI